MRFVVYVCFDFVFVVGFVFYFDCLCCRRILPVRLNCGLFVLDCILADGLGVWVW